MKQIRSFLIEDLFEPGNTHKIDFSKQGPVTIISGPNGVGKTHILKFLHAILRKDVQQISAIPFRAATLTLADGKSITLKREEDEHQITLSLEGAGPRGGKIGSAKFGGPQVGDELLYGRYQLVHTRERGDRFFDTVNRRYVPRSAVLEYGRLLDRRRHSLEQSKWWDQSPLFTVIGEDEVDLTWLDEILEGRAPIFIDTKRLDTLERPQGDTGTTHPRSRIDLYIEQVKIQVSDARQASLAASQEADRTFASRVLSPLTRKSVVKEEDLKRRYEEIAEQNAELHRSGLSEAVVDVQFPSGRVDATIARVLTFFLDDWQQKLRPLLPVNEKLKSLRRIVNEKFLSKKLMLDSSGGLVFVSLSDQTLIPVRVLSSGEQHILALFTMLLFSAQPGSVVLIDEPEISLHAAWKHAFLNDITEVASIADLQIILATHSSGIVNGQWEIVQELGSLG